MGLSIFATTATRLVAKDADASLDLREDFATVFFETGGDGDDCRTGFFVFLVILRSDSIEWCSASCAQSSGVRPLKNMRKVNLMCEDAVEECRKGMILEILNLHSGTVLEEKLGELKVSLRRR